MSRRFRAVHYGVIAGLLAVAAQAFFGVDRPPAYGICIACHGEDAANWTVNHVAGTSLEVSAITRGASLPLLTTVGVLIGAALAAIRNREWRFLSGGNPLTAAALGALVSISALTVLGCPTRLWLRVGYGEALALLAVTALMGGIAAGTALLAWRARRV